MNLLRIALMDLKRVAKDWQAGLWMLVMPLVFSYIFGSAFRGGPPPATWIPVIDLDRSELSGLLIEQLRGEGYEIETSGPGEQHKLKNRWPYGVVIPAGFGDNVLKGQAVQLQVVKGNGAPEKIMDVQARLAQAIVRFTKALAITDTSHHAWTAETREALKQNLAQPQRLTVTRRGHHSLRPPPTGFAMSLPGFLVMFVMQMLITYGGVTLVSDRLNGQLSRLMAAPVRDYEVYAGKILARTLLALFQAVLLLTIGSWVFRIPFADHPLFLLPVVLSLALFAGSLSLFCGLICKTEKQVVQIAIFATMLLCALGGCWWPIEIVPDLFKQIALLTPSYWGVHGLQSVLYFGKSWQPLLLECPILLGFAFLALLLAFPFAKKIAKGRGP